MWGGNAFWHSSFDWCHLCGLLWAWIWFRSDVPGNYNARTGGLEITPFSGRFSGVTDGSHLWSLSPAAQEMSDYQLRKLSEAQGGMSKRDPGQNTHQETRKATQLSSLRTTIQLLMGLHSYLTVWEPPQDAAKVTGRGRSMGSICSGKLKYFI